jgi:hypothetical protein
MSQAQFAPRLPETKSCPTLRCLAARKKIRSIAVFGIAAGSTKIPAQEAKAVSLPTQHRTGKIRIAVDPQTVYSESEQTAK